MLLWLFWMAFSSTAAAGASLQDASDALGAGEPVGSRNELRVGGHRNTQYVNEFGEWEKDEDVTECLSCGVKFSFIMRIHHCRCCGRIYCGNCCYKYAWYDKNRVKVVVKSPTEKEVEPYRTCDSCYENLSQMKLLRTPWGDIQLPRNSSRTGNLGNSSSFLDNASSSVPPFFEVSKNNNVVETVRDAESERSSARQIAPNSDEDYERCPICNFDLRVLGTNELAQQEHVTECIQQAELAQQQHNMVGSPTYQNRMLVYKIPENTTNIQECPICFEEMVPGEKVGRLECLCVFHYECIKSWFKKKSQKLMQQNSGTEASLLMLGKNYCPFHDAIYY